MNSISYAIDAKGETLKSFFERVSPKQGVSFLSRPCGQKAKIAYLASLELSHPAVSQINGSYISCVANYLFFYAISHLAFYCGCNLVASRSRCLLMADIQCLPDHTHTYPTQTCIQLES